jgi:CubicO group peptidase (beta-lactamase class C family)
MLASAPAMPVAFAPSDVTLENWRSQPFSRWSFQNVDRLIPVATIAAEGSPEPDAGSGDLLDAAITYRHGERVSLTRHLQRTGGDAVVVMRDGKVLAEWYAPHVDRARPHTVFSISKSVTGMLAGIAVGDGKLDPNALIADYLPVSPGTAYGDARVRDLLDMTVGVAFEDGYLDRAGLFDRYRRAMLWNPQRPGTFPETLEEVLLSLEPAGAHGRLFHYASPNTDMLGLVIERATGERYHDYLAQRLWRPMGAKGGAYVTVDRAGTSRAAGGLCMTARDLARFGQLLLDDGLDPEGRQVIPAAWIADMRQNGDARAWRDGGSADMFPSGRYRSSWYQTGNDREPFCAIGIHAQWLWIDPVRRLVIVKLSSRDVPSDDAATALEIAMMENLARQL